MKNFAALSVETPGRAVAAVNLSLFVFVFLGNLVYSLWAGREHYVPPILCAVWCIYAQWVATRGNARVRWLRVRKLKESAIGVASSAIMICLLVRPIYGWISG
jgi:hypothetical protein